MRIWSLHPSYLDAKGIVALWRETLLAQKVLKGETKGYRNHPQLERFKAVSDPLAAIATYLDAVYDEAVRRSYSFDKSKIGEGRFKTKIPVTNGQLEYEFEHLKKKLSVRDKERFEKVQGLTEIETHSLFIVIDGPMESWEVV